MAEERFGATEARTFLLASVLGATAAWDLSFNLAVYETVFFSKVFYLWAASLAVFTASFFVGDYYSPVTRWERVPLILPTVWIIITLVTESDSDTVSTLMVVLGLVVYAISLPYIFYVIVAVTNTGVLRLKNPRLLVVLVLIVFSVGAVGYLVGANHDVFLTCEDFALSGNHVPEGCTTVEDALDVLGP